MLLMKPTKFLTDLNYLQTIKNTFVLVLNFKYVVVCELLRILSLAGAYIVIWENPQKEIKENKIFGNHNQCVGFFFIMLSD